jgi:small-conductance mechanosensitive channel
MKKHVCAVVALFALTSVLLVAAGFGAQHLMRDLISGFFLIAEGQIRWQ